MRGRLLAAALALSLVLPFIGKPLHVDDVFFLALGRAMRADPPFGSSVRYNWTGWDAPLAVAGFANPPAWPWLLSVVDACGGSEPVMRTLQIPFLFLALLCVGNIAGGLKALPLVAIALTALCPLVWVSATTLMPDLPCMALGLLAIALFRKKPARKLGGAAAIFAAGAAKFSVAPLYAVALPLAPAAALAAGALTFVWPAANFAALKMGGISMTELAPRLEQTWQASFYPNYMLAKGVYSLTAMAAGIVFPGVFWVLALSRLRQRWRQSLLVLAAVLAILALLRLAGAWKALELPGGPLYEVVHDHTALWFLGSVLGMGTWLGGLLAQRGSADWRDTRMLLIWIAAVWLASALIPAHTGARYSLLAAPAIVILVIRDINRLVPKTVRRWTIAALIASTAWLGFAITWSDWQFATCASSLVEQAWQVRGLDRKRVYTTGHWGVQHTTTKLGGSMLDIGLTRLQPGDVILVPLYGNSHYLSDNQRAGIRFVDAVWCYPPDSGVRTILPKLSTCFYGGKVWLPYSFVWGYDVKLVIPERLMIIEVAEN